LCVAVSMGIYDYDRRQASAPSEDLRRARQLGIDAFNAGKKAVPAQDVALRDGLIHEYSGDTGAVIQILDAWHAGWIAARNEMISTSPVVETVVVEDALESLLAAVHKAKAANNSGNDKRMFFALLGAIDALGIIGRAYEVENMGFLVRVWKGFAKLSGGRPTTNF